MIADTARFVTIRLKTQGKRGFLGIGRKPNLYEVEVFQPVVAEVRFRHKARIRVEIGDTPPEPEGTAADDFLFTRILGAAARVTGTSVKDLGIHELSGICDFCRDRCRGEVFSAKQIASAARRGFCPSAAKRMGWSASKWQQHATTGAASETDWLVCSSCVKELRSYL